MWDIIFTSGIPDVFRSPFQVRLTIVDIRVQSRIMIIVGMTAVKVSVKIKCWYCFAAPEKRPFPNYLWPLFQSESWSSSEGGKGFMRDA